MRDRDEKVTEERGRLLTWRSGGWVLALAGVVLASLVVWALWAPLFRAVNRPPGDGVDPASYGFDISTLEIPLDLVATPLLHRDMVPVMRGPAILSVADVEARAEGRKKYLVSSDRVVGVEIGGEARAYPLTVLTVHEIVEDTLGGVPIAVTYSWLGDAVRVFDRRLGDEVVSLGTSGLVYNCNTLLYDRRPGTGGESLWVQLTGEAVSGPRRDERLETIPYRLVSWRAWLARHPETTVIDQDPALPKRYKKALPTQYFNSDRIPYPYAPATEGDGPPAKARIVAIERGGERRVYLHGLIRRRAMAADDAAWRDTWNDLTITFIPDLAGTSDTVDVDLDPPNADAEIVHAFWFVWKAMHPEDEVIAGGG